jgi:hypothetical protein
MTRMLEWNKLEDTMKDAENDNNKERKNENWIKFDNEREREYKWHEYGLMQI